MNHWVYYTKSNLRNTFSKTEIKSIEDMPKGVVGFVYKITNTKTNEFYIGKKILHHKRTLPPLKGKKRRRVKYIESDWKKYMGSSEVTKKWNAEDCVKEISHFCFNKTMMSYLECFDILFSGFPHNKSVVNDNILGKFYKEKLNKYSKDAREKMKDYLC